MPKTDPTFNLSALNDLRPEAFYLEEEVGIWGKRTMAEMRYKREGPPFIRVRGRIIYRGEAILAWLRGLEGVEEPKDV